MHKGLHKKSREGDTSSRLRRPSRYDQMPGTWSGLVGLLRFGQLLSLGVADAVVPLLLVPLLAEHGTTDDEAGEDHLEHLLTKRVLLVELREEHPDDDDGSEEPQSTACDCLSHGNLLSNRLDRTLRPPQQYQIRMCASSIRSMRTLYA